MSRIITKWENKSCGNSDISGSPLDYFVGPYDPCHSYQLVEVWGRLVKKLLMLS